MYTAIIINGDFYSKVEMRIMFKNGIVCLNTEEQPHNLMNQIRGIRISLVLLNLDHRSNYNRDHLNILYNELERHSEDFDTKLNIIRL